MQTFPNTRMRRLRLNQRSRSLVQEHTLSPNDFILPIFITEGQNQKTPVPSMPGVNRLSIDLATQTAKKAASLGIPAIALFPVIDSKLKTPQAEAAYDDNGLIPNAIKAIKDAVPNISLISDIALDPYTSHGQDGLIDENGYVINDQTTDILLKQALCHASAGVDMVAPSDMMDGRIGKIRDALEASRFHNTIIISYAAKYASSFYGPFRDAVGSTAQLKSSGQGGKESYQMDPANINEAIHEVALDLQEGADIIMVKPGLPYLDVVRTIKNKFKCPTFVYQVSGEYAMIKAAGEKNWLDSRSVMLESLMCIKRAGADAIFSYFALDAAEALHG